MVCIPTAISGWKGTLSHSELRNYRNTDKKPYDNKLNKLNKSNTVSFRGTKNLELSKYGSEFKIIPHPSKSDLFVLTSEKTVKIESPKGDDNIYVEEQDIDLDSIIDEQDANITEIDSSFFKL